MSEFDVYEAAFAGDLVARLGDADGVEHEDRASKKRTKYDAIVENLRTEPVETVRGNNIVTEHMDLVRASIKCPAGAVGIDDPLAIFKFTTSAANYLAERFVVRTVESSDAAWTIVEAWRKHLSSIKQQGS